MRFSVSPVAPIHHASLGPLAHLCAVIAVACGATDAAASVTRMEALEIAQSFASDRWRATDENRLHGADRAGVEVHTPDRPSGRGSPAEECWQPGEENIGMPYKWGGFDSIPAFAAGIARGKAAGDVYTMEKRRRGSAAVSYAAVGIDCSGFVSRCWKLTEKHGTATLPSVCRKLRAAVDLLPGDIMNQAGGHVLLFARWIDREKTRALFYEAAPFSKVRSMEYRVAELEAAGFQPLRYRDMRDR